MSTLILASASPRRAAILRQLGLSFTVRARQIEEDAFAGSQILRVESLALAKARAAEPQAEEIVLAADTLVLSDGEIMGKPQNDAEARRMLSALSGKVHQVTTGLATIDRAAEFVAHQITEVRMRKLSLDEIERYVATGEPRDKAGAYGIQGRGAALVEEISGCYYNVVGLPLALLVAQLKNFGLRVI